MCCSPKSSQTRQELRGLAEGPAPQAAPGLPLSKSLIFSYVGCPCRKQRTRLKVLHV